MKISRSAILDIFLFISIFAIAVTIHIWASDNGIGIGPDSISYFGTANKILEGNAQAIKTSHFPPFYPILLAVSASFNSDVIGSARWLHALLYGLNAVLVGLFIFLGTRRNRVAMILGSLVFLCSKSTFAISSYAWSESPFLTLSLIAYLLFSFYITSGKWVYLVFSSLSLGLAIATRYAGFALLPPVVLGLLVLPKQPWKTKLKAATVAAVLGLAPVCLWMVRNLFRVGTATNRLLIYHPQSITSMGRSIIEVFHGWIFPAVNSKYIAAFEILIVILILVYIIAALFKKRTIFTRSDTFTISAIFMGLVFSITYIFAVLFSITFFDSATPLNERILLPVNIFLTISVICLVFQFSGIEKKQTIWLLFIACVLFSLRINIFPMINAVQDLHLNGLGYNARSWNESPTITILNSMKPDRLIFSNGYDVIQLKTRWDSVLLPKRFAPSNLIENDQYEEELSAICDQVLKGDAILVYLDDIGRNYLPKEDQLLQKCPLPVLYDTEDGTIYGLPKN